MKKFCFTIMTLLCLFFTANDVYAQKGKVVRKVIIKGLKGVSTVVAGKRLLDGSKDSEDQGRQFECVNCPQCRGQKGYYTYYYYMAPYWNPCNVCGGKGYILREVD